MGVLYLFIINMNTGLAASEYVTTQLHYKSSIKT